MVKKSGPDRYSAIIESVFFKHFALGREEFEFTREEFASTAEQLAIKPPKNLGDVLYSFRYRKNLPESIRQTPGESGEWIIEGAGRSKYRFRKTEINRIVPRNDLASVKIPDATPEIIAAHAQTDEQALLAKIRYNRLVDIFLGMATYSLQNHLRTTVAGIGQIEVDEIYVGIDRHGRQFVIPVQAKGGNDRHGAVQTQQDIACCKAKFPTLLCRPISAQFMSDNRIALFELVSEGDGIKIVEERHYRLVPAADISADDLRAYNIRAKS